MNEFKPTEVLDDLATDPAKIMRLGGACVAGLAAVDFVGEGIGATVEYVRNMSVQGAFVTMGEDVGFVALGVFMATLGAKQLDNLISRHFPSNRV